jgi:hypothetical protein
MIPKLDIVRGLCDFQLDTSVLTFCRLGFLVGPLLMHMGEREAFCVLVRYAFFFMHILIQCVS